MFNDLRQFIAKAEEAGEVKHIEGADWNLEIGLITEVEASQPSPRLLLFDRIKDYPPGYRVASNLFSTPRRVALAFGLPEDLAGMDLVRAMKARLDKGVRPIPPVVVKTGPVMENVFTGDQVDILKFPTPWWRKGDGGRYIGTHAVTITRDPDEGWVNIAPQRVQVHNRNTASIFMATGHHGDIMRRKYWAKGKGCPVAVSCGQEPLIFAAGEWPLPWGSSEFEFAGGLKEAPIEVVKGVTTDLPIPATSEIVLEGELLPPEAGTVIEGPFGEWAGYYAGGARPEPIFRVNAVMHRNNPIIQGTLASVHPAVWTLGRHIWRSAVVWSELDRQVPGVQGVWVVGEAGANSMIAASIKQMYPGHAKQTAQLLNAVQATSLHIRYCIVVDEDIDPSNLPELIWAIGTRTNPVDSIDIARFTRTSETNPAVSPDKRQQGDFTHSTALIVACRPWHWRDKYAKATKSDAESLKEIRRKWSKVWLSQDAPQPVSPRKKS
ncbi:MAG: UbiD family decarboxylase [Chloroflexota bacterium]